MTTVILQQDPGTGIATVTLDRPEAGNAIDLPTARAFRDAIAQLADDPCVRVLVLAASGPRFCVGGDVRSMAAARERSAFLRELAGTMHAGLAQLRSLSAPIVAAVQGPVAGAGIGLVLAADLVIAAESARFLSGYAGIGLTPDCGVSMLLPATVGPRRAAVFAAGSTSLSAADALDWGLVSEVCPEDELVGRVATMARALSGIPGQAAGKTARLLRQATAPDYVAHLAREAETIADLAGGAEASALISAFSEGRGR